MEELKKQLLFAPKNGYATLTAEQKEEIDCKLCRSKAYIIITLKEEVMKIQRPKAKRKSIYL